MLDSIRLKARMDSIMDALFGLVTLGIACWIFFGFLSSYFIAKLQPPTSISAATLDAGLEKPLYFASVTGETYDTGYSWTHVVAGGRRSSWVEDDDHFGLLDVGDRYLMIYTPYPVDEARANWVGTVYPMPDDITQQILTPLTAHWPQISGLVYPYFLHVVEAEEGFGYYLGLILFLIFAALTVYIFVSVVRATVNPKHHEIYKGLARFGVPLEKVAEKIEADFKQGVVKIGSFEFGKVFFVRRTFYTFKAMLYRDLIWAYLLVQNVQGGEKTIMCFCDKYGMEMKWKTDRKDAQKILTLIKQRAPWAYTGDVQEYRQMWTRDRKQMIAKVDQQRVRQRQERDARQAEPQPDYTELPPLIRR